MPPFWYLEGPFRHLGGALGDHGSSRKDTWVSGIRFFISFVTIVGYFSEGFLGTGDALYWD